MGSTGVWGVQAKGTGCMKPQVGEPVDVMSGYSRRKVWIIDSSEAKEGWNQSVDMAASILLGAVPATGFLRQSGIGLDSRGFIPVNKVGLSRVGRVLGWGWPEA